VQSARQLTQELASGLVVPERELKPAKRAERKDGVELVP
jgi:hypothetical protein